MYTSPFECLTIPFPVETLLSTDREFKNYYLPWFWPLTCGTVFIRFGSLISVIIILLLFLNARWLFVFNLFAVCFNHWNRGVRLWYSFIFKSLSCQFLKETWLIECDIKWIRLTWNCSWFLNFLVLVGNGHRFVFFSIPGIWATQQ